MPTATPATRALDELGIPYRLFEHLQLPNSLEAAARARGQTPQQVIRSILFRHEQEYFVMVLVAGPGQIAWKQVREHLGVTRLSMATEEELLQVTGYEIGAVCPFGLPHPVRLLADVSVFQPEEVSLGSGRRGTAIVMKSADLRHALTSVEVGAFT